MINNFSYLNEVSCGLPEFIVELLEKYITGVPNDFALLQSVAQNNDDEEIRKAAHKLISSTRIVGAEVLTEKLKFIEKESIKGGFSNQALDIIKEIEPLIHQSIEESKEKIKELS